MSAEFTGERVIPGQVDVDLWNEHVSRYTFASRFAGGRRVLDVGCGTGYGTAELARTASSAIGLDPSTEALDFARANHSQPNTQWVGGSATHTPFLDHAFDLIVCFEVIEHLERWRDLLKESRRLLTEPGYFVVSTPNRSFYAESRAQSGPNPFHVHEFEYGEFSDVLREVFPHVSMFVQDHSQCVLFRAIDGSSAVDAQLVKTEASPEHANFFVAVCTLAPQPVSPSFIYVPSSANVLRERTLHINRLQSEIKLKERWLAETQTERDQLTAMLKTKDAEVEERTAWAAKLDADLTAASERVVALQKEVEEEHQAAQNAIAAYESKVRELEGELQSRTEWAMKTEQELADRDASLAACHHLLQEAEKTVEERTLWAQSLDRERESLTAKVSAVQASRWMKLGRMLGLGPETAKQ